MIDWISEWDPVKLGKYLVTCEYLHDGERFTDESGWLGDMWEITAPGNDYAKPFRVVAWAEYPEPFRKHLQI